MTDLKTDQLNAAYQLALTGRNMLVLGQAGSGKSTLIRALIDYFKSRDDKQCLVVAPTHKAALGVGGCTLASKIYKNYKLKNKFRITDRILSINNKLGRIIKFVGRFGEEAENINVIIIDEFGMVRADSLQELDMALKKLHKNGLPFGGVQVIAVGDYKQIPPVLTENLSEEYFSYYSSIYNFCAPAFKEANFFPVNITHNLRMREHPDQVILLEMIRKQENLDYVAQELNKMLTIIPNEINDTLYVTKYNVVVDKVNQKKLNQLEGREYNLLRKDFVLSTAYCKNKIKAGTPEDTLRFCEPQFVGAKNKKDKIKSVRFSEILEAKVESKVDKDGMEEYLVADRNFESLPNQYEALPRQIKIKVGAKVMTYFNGADVGGKKYYNGQVFILIGSKDKNKLVLRDVDTHEEYIIERIATPIVVRRISHEEEVLDHIGYQFQFPIILAYAQTYHKTQGMTLKSYVLDTRGRDFADGLTYVGLSRAVNLRDIIVTAPINAENLKISQEVMDFYNNIGAF